MLIKRACYLLSYPGLKPSLVIKREQCFTWRMKSVRRIAVLLIFLMIAPSAWAMACATACTMGAQKMSPEQAADGAASAFCCHDDAAPGHSSGGVIDCGMAAACHFAASAALSASPQIPFLKNDMPFTLPISAAPRSADTPPPYKPPA